LASIHPQLSIAQTPTGNATTAGNMTGGNMTGGNMTGGNMTGGNQTGGFLGEIQEGIGNLTGGQ
jgi:hypothetical protein